MSAKVPINPGLVEELTGWAEQARSAIAAATGAAFALVEGEQVRCVAVAGSCAPPVGSKLSRKGVAGFCLAAGQPIRCLDARTELPPQARDCLEWGARSAVLAPIREMNRVRGILAVFSGKKEAFSEGDVAGLETLADQMSAMLQFFWSDAPPAYAVDAPEPAYGDSRDAFVLPVEMPGIEMPPVGLAEIVPSETQVVLPSPMISTEPPPAAGTITATMEGVSEARTTVPDLASALSQASTIEAVPVEMASALSHAVVTNIEAAPAAAKPVESEVKPPPLAPIEIPKAPPSAAASTTAPPAAARVPLTLVPTRDSAAKQPLSQPTERIPAPVPAAAAATPAPAPPRPALVMPSVHTDPAPKVAAAVAHAAVRPKRTLEWRLVTAAVTLAAIGAAAWAFRGRLFNATAYSTGASTASSATPGAAAAAPAPLLPASTNPPQTSGRATQKPLAKAAAASAPPKPQAAGGAPVNDLSFRSSAPAPSRVAEVSDTAIPAEALKSPSALPAPAPTPEVAPPAVTMTTSDPTALPVLPASTPAGPLRSLGATPNQVIHRVMPEYPMAARILRASSTVVVEVQVLEDGGVGNITWVKGNTLFRQAAISAVKQWRYQPATLDGQPAESTAVIELRFLPQ